MSDRSVFAELKRRHVYKVGAAYAVGGWLFVQVATQVFPIFDVPMAWVRLVVIVVALGFPVALVLSWVFDITADGVVRTDDAPPDAASPDRVAATPGRRGIERKLNLLLGSLLLIAVAWLAGERFIVSTESTHSGATGAPAAAPPSIAVLAFTDMSEGGDQGYFADGISEELLNLLAQVPQLHVAGRSSSFSFKGTKTSIKDIGKALDVTSVLEGGVRKVGDRLRVTAQLVNVADGFQLWSESYDRKLTDIFAVQDDIAGAVVDALRFKLLPAERPSTSKQHVPSFETYDHYLLGRQLLTRNDAKDYAAALVAFHTAVALDPAYADAFAGLAMAESFTSEDEPDPKVRDGAHARAMAAANRAVELGPNLGDAYAARGYLRASHDWDWSGGLADVRKAISLDPADARNQLRFAYLLAALGRLPEAAAALTDGTAKDPLFAPAWYWLGRVRNAQGNYAEATAALQRTLAIEPDSVVAKSGLGVVALLQGDAAKARELFVAAKRPLGVAMADQDLGHAEASTQALRAFIENHAGDSPYAIATYYAWCNNRDEAFAWLDRAVTQRDLSLQSVKYDPLLRRLRDDPRYAALLRRMKLPE